MSLISQIPTATTGYVELIHAVIIPFNTGLQSPALEEGQGRGMKKKKQAECGARGADGHMNFRRASRPDRGATTARPSVKYVT